MLAVGQSTSCRWIKLVFRFCGVRGGFAALNFFFCCGARCFYGGLEGECPPRIFFFRLCRAALLSCTDEMRECRERRPEGSRPLPNPHHVNLCLKGRRVFNTWVHER